MFIAQIEDYKIFLIRETEVFPYPLAFEGFFFNEFSHLNQQAASSPFVFFLLHQKSQTIVARVAWFVAGQEAISPCRASFGGIECDPKLAPIYLSFLVEKMEQFLKEQGVTSFHIRSYPVAYAPEMAQLTTHVLLQAGYQLKTSELNYHIPVGEQDFAEKIHLSEQRRLKKSQKAGFSFEEISNPAILKVYQFIEASRHRKDFPMTLDFVSFEKLMQRFSTEFKVFQVLSAQKEIAALGVVISINPRILYHFYPADAEAYLPYSPTVLLNAGLYQYAQAQGYQILDLGIATQKGAPNSGLIRFKQNLGAETSLKLSFTK